MKAIVYERYGPPEVLQLQEVNKPTPKEGEVLVRIRVTTVHAGDVRMRKPDPFLARLVAGLFRPRRIPILGMELAGDVETVGRQVSCFAPGERVFGFAGFGFGAYAEYKCLPAQPKPGKTAKEGLLVPIPTGMSYEQAAPLAGGGATALRCLRQAHIQPGQSVLVYGASGSVGSYAVQLAKLWGATVTAVCSERNAEMVRGLGADQAIDYTREDFVASNAAYDVVFDAVDKLATLHGKRALKPGGVYLNVAKDSDAGGDLAVKDLAFMSELVASGELETFIDRRYPLEQMVEAHRYVETGHKRGNVIITVD